MKNVSDLVCIHVLTGRYITRTSHSEEIETIDATRWKAVEAVL